MRAISSKRLMLLSFALMIGFAGCASGSGGGGGGHQRVGQQQCRDEAAGQQFGCRHRRGSLDGESR